MHCTRKETQFRGELIRLLRTRVVYLFLMLLGSTIIADCSCLLVRSRRMFSVVSDASMNDQKTGYG